MYILANFISMLISLYIFVVIIYVLIHWLIAFDVINARSRQAQNLMHLLHKLTDPVLSRIQKYVPPVGGIDLSPLVVILLGQVLIWMTYQILVY